MDTKQAWSGDFGNEYLRRNRVDWQARIPFWEYIIRTTGARSVFEFGANAGWNLSAIKRAYPDVLTEGVEINEQAQQQARDVGLDVYTPSSTAYCGKCELVFTAGVLIHIPPEELETTMQSLVDRSSDYVLAIEYDSDQEEEVNYRGQDGMLWKRPYGQLYQDMGLTLVESKYSVEGFNDCTFWLLRK